MRRASAEKAHKPGVRSTRPAGRQTFPRYVAIGNAKKVAYSQWLIFDRVRADYAPGGELIGIEIIG